VETFGQGVHLADEVRSEESGQGLDFAFLILILGKARFTLPGKQHHVIALAFDCQNSDNFIVHRTAPGPDPQVEDAAACRDHLPARDTAAPRLLGEPCRDPADLPLGFIPRRRIGTGHQSEPVAEGV
jgi:hypothetical protein